MNIGTAAGWGTSATAALARGYGLTPRSVMASGLRSPRHSGWPLAADTVSILNPDPIRRGIGHAVLHAHP